MNNNPEHGARSSLAGAAYHSSQEGEEELPPPNPTAASCRPPPIVFWAVALLSWLTFWPVAMLTTPGNDWLRQEGERLDWFKIGGTSGLDRNCEQDEGILNGDWCDKFSAFSVVQGAAALSIAMAALMLMIALFWTIPRPWSIAAGTFLMFYSLMQAVAVVLVAIMKVDIENSDSRDSSDGSVENDSSGSISSTSSSTGFFVSSFPIKLEFGVTFYLALYGAIIAFNESLLLYALADYSGEGPWRGCLRCKPCKVADSGYATPGIFEPRDPSAAPVYPTRTHRIITGQQR